MFIFFFAKDMLKSKIGKGVNVFVFDGHAHGKSFVFVCLLFGDIIAKSE
jgi:hypothetical protein